MIVYYNKVTWVSHDTNHSRTVPINIYSSSWLLSTLQVKGGNPPISMVIWWQYLPGIWKAGLAKPSNDMCYLLDFMPWTWDFTKSWCLKIPLENKLIIWIIILFEKNVVSKNLPFYNNIFFFRKRSNNFTVFYVFITKMNQPWPSQFHTIITFHTIINTYLFFLD